jgi:ATP-dependent DNA helicase DinG
MKGQGVSRRISEFLGPNGYFAKDLDNYEYRSEQVIMAKEMLRAFQDARFLMVEAGTGTGKTFADLIPAILSGQKVVITSGTKNLQEQIYFKDLPELSRHFDFKAALMKGRSNYLCWYKYRNFIREPLFPFREDINAFKSIEDWVIKTKTGDRAEVPDLPDDYATWREISATSEQCIGSQCPDFKECFITKMRQAAQEADIIIVNHYLFFADLCVRGGGFGEVIPRYRTVIFDEAHQLEEIATEYFGFQVSDFRVEDLIRDVLKGLNAFIRDPGELKGFKIGVDVLRTLSKNFFSGVSGLSRGRRSSDSGDDGGNRFLLEEGDISEELEDKGFQLQEALKDFSSRFNPWMEKDVNAANFKERADKISRELRFILGRDDPDFVYWCETRPRSNLLRASPLEVGPTLQEDLYSQVDTAVFTSATLATSQKGQWSFDYIKSRLGLEEMGPRMEELKLDSSFDFKEQAVFYLPGSLPDPNDRDFAIAAAEEMEKLLNISRGRAFLLFTSFRNLRRCYEILERQLPFPLLRQGDKPRTALIEEFRETGNSVLFATASFWQGVDVIGPALSLVVIDKLPFAPPSDPLVSARISRIKQLEGDPFNSYQVPAAVIALKQGLGRLIRSSNDFGILAVLDSRLRKRRYGKVFIESLPQTSVTDDIEQVRKFFKSKEKENRG